MASKFLTGGTGPAQHGPGLEIQRADLPGCPASGLTALVLGRSVLGHLGLGSRAHMCVFFLYVGARQSWLRKAYA